MKQVHAAILGMLGIALAGCGSKDPKFSYEPMGEAAPALGSSAEVADLAQFVVGRWILATVTDQQWAQQLGMSAVSEDESDPNEWFEFRGDGTFDYGNKRLEIVTKGKWTVQGERIDLDYQTMNGRTFAEARAEIQQKAEAGRSSAIGADLAYDSVFQFINKAVTLSIGPDKKKLVFSGMQAPGIGDAPSTLENGAPMPVTMAQGLERVKKTED